MWLNSGNYRKIIAYRFIWIILEFKITNDLKYWKIIEYGAK